MKNKPKCPLVSGMRCAIPAAAAAAASLLVAALLCLQVAASAGEQQQQQPIVSSAASSTNVSQAAPATSTTTSSASKLSPDVLQNATENQANRCPVPCTNAEYLEILNKISLNVDLIRDFQRNESAATPSASAGQSKSSKVSSDKQRQQQQQQQIRPECVRQLIQMVKNLASGELEMKTLLEFASSTSQINLRSDLSYLRASYTSDKERDLERRRRQLELARASGCSKQQLQANVGQPPTLDAAASSLAEYYLLGDEPSAQAAEVDKSHFLPKLVASIDQWLDTIERFTITREWAALMRVSNGAESILNMFANTTTTATGPLKQQHSRESAAGGAKQSLASIGKSIASIQRAPGLSSELLDRLERELPSQVQTLTGSLNQLFPWHVWPWNNIDLYSTIDTFLNHGIFAFSKTTSGPERRIDYLSQMLETLFKSLKHESFPKKCNDWSRQICDLELFYDRLALAPSASLADGGEPSSEELAKRRLQVKQLTGDNKNKLTQELVCIMFSSLSMQQFGAKDVDLKSFDQLDASDTPPALGAAPASGQQAALRWSRQIRKGLKLYKLSREALTDEQWAALYRQFNELWNQMKISDRVIMVGRIVQLLTNCHMPREILESALWKDIYKYKNALNQVSDIVIEELNRSSENGKFTIGQLAIGSKHLEDILTRFIKLLPRLIESLSQTLTDQLPELVGKFFDEKIAFFKGPCKGHSFSELVPSLGKHRDEILELERLVCQQLRTKPSITMSQINNLTNEFLAMAFNFTNLGNSFQSLPRLWSATNNNNNNNNNPTSQSANHNAMQAVEQAASAIVGAGKSLGVSPQVASAAGAAIVAATKQNLNMLLISGSPPINGTGQEVAAAPQVARREDNFELSNGGGSGGATRLTNETSIIDELAANPRLAQIVAILQSSALDPPEVHAELPELDWVEAGTSVALLYETVQKLMSFEGLFVVFPEVGDFQDQMRDKVESSKRMFTKFSKKDPTNLVAYLLDTVMPVALRTFQPLDSFHGECFSTFRDLFGETDFVEASVTGSVAAAAATAAGNGQQQQQPAAGAVSRESRQWQCAVSATNFASFALNQLVRTFNSMLRNILQQMSRQRDLYKFKQAPSLQVQVQAQVQAQNASTANNHGNTSSSHQQQTNATCVLFDGSITTLMDNLPQLVDLGLETILIASTTTNQRLSLKDTLCSFENTLDPLAEHQYLQKQFKLREAICHLLHESSLSTCADALRVDQWTSTMKELNSTWFEASAIGVEPSFRAILGGVHEFLDLFGKVKPSSMSDGLIARVLNFNSYWTGLMNKAVSTVEKYREKRFQLALQILMPIIYDNLPLYNDNTNSTMDETKLALKTSILSARAILSYLSRPESGESLSLSSSSQNSTTTTTTNNNNNTAMATTNTQDLVDQQLRSLFDWADRHSIVISETLIRTVANNLTKFEQLFNSTNHHHHQATNNSANQTWTRFCLAPVDAYLELEQLPASALDNRASLASQAKIMEMRLAKETICKFEWSLLRDRLFHQANLSTLIVASSVNSAPPAAAGQQQNASSTSIDQYSTRQLIRVSLTKWGQVMDLVFASVASSGGGANGPRKALRLPKFFSLNHWQALQARLPQLTPSQYDPTNFIWIWRAFEHLINTIDQVNRQHHYSVSNATAAATSSVEKSAAQSSSSSSAEALIKIFDQLNCALDAVKGGITWDNMVNIYQDRQDVLAAHTTLNNGIALASASANTFLAHKKFQKFLNNFVKPRLGLAAFCDMRDKTRLENIFSSSMSGGGGHGLDEDLAEALESFQEFICDTNLETFVQNINPISICYQQPQPQPQASNSHISKVVIGGGNSTTTTTSTTSTTTTTVTPPAQQQQQQPGAQLAETIDRFFKLASLAILDAKLVDTSDAKPPIFDEGQWAQLRLWWLNQTEAHQGNSGLALTLVRVFQTLDSINSEHVVWRAIFRSIHELSEVSAYLVRAAEMERQATREQRERGQPTKLALIREAAEQVDSVMRDSAGGGNVAGGKIGTAGPTNQLKFGHKQQQLASTLANVMFPEVSNFISLKTFKQLRYIKSISEYFAQAPGVQQSLCKNLTLKANHHQRASKLALIGANDTTTTSGERTNQGDQGDGDDDDFEQDLIDGNSTTAKQQQQRSKFELIDYKLNTSKRLYSLLCHYHSSQWLTAMNIVLSSKTSSLSKKVNYMTKYLLIFTKNFEHNENLQSFIHGQQLENIEAVANTTVSYMIALTQPFRTLTLSKISNISWHSIPNLLDSIDRHLCISKNEQAVAQMDANESNNGAAAAAAAAAAHGPATATTPTSANSNQQQQQQQQTYQLAVYEPKKPDIETLICKLPSWNITQVYSYISENIDLQNMISLATQNNHTASLFGLAAAATPTSLRNQTSTSTKQQQQQQPKTCITPFKFASKWLKIAQDLIDETMSKSSRDKIRKCLNSNKKSQSLHVQALRYVKILNSFLSTINDLTLNNSWPLVRRTWNSISFAILNQSGQTPAIMPIAAPNQMAPVVQ